MRKRILCLCLALAGCGTVVNRPDPANVVTSLMLEPPPIYSLLGYRSDLELTSEQVTALDSIAQAVREENRPIVTELERSAERGGRNQGVIIISEQTRPLLDRIRENNRRAVEAIAELLTPGQETEVCALFDLERRGEERERRVRRPPATAADSARAGLSGPVWYWCAPE